MSDLDSAFDPYAVLGLNSRATEIDIKHAFRKLVAELHPDRKPEPDSVERFKQVVTAWEILSDEGKKAEYDRRAMGIEIEEWYWRPQVPPSEPPRRQKTDPAEPESAEARRRRKAELEERYERKYREEQAELPPEEPESLAWSLSTSVEVWACAVAVTTVIWTLLPSTQMDALTHWNVWTWRTVLWGLTATGCCQVCFCEAIDESPLGRLWALFQYGVDPTGRSPHRIIGILEGGPAAIAFTGWVLLIGSPLVFYWLISAAVQAAKPTIP